MNRIKENCFFIFKFFISIEISLSLSLVKFFILDRFIPNNYKILKEILKTNFREKKNSPSLSWQVLL